MELSLSSLKWFSPFGYSFGNAKPIQLGSEVNDTGLLFTCFYVLFGHKLRQSLLLM